MSDLRSGIELGLLHGFNLNTYSYITGSGIFVAVQFLASNTNTNAMMDPPFDTNYAEKIKVKAASIVAKNSCSKANVEDYIKVINELLRGLDVLGYDTEEETGNNSLLMYPNSWCNVHF